MPVAVAGHRAFGALLAAVDRAAPGHLAPARGLGDRAVHGQVVQVQPDHLVVAGQRGPQHLLADPGVGPVVESAADGAVRAARGGDALVAAAVHQRGDHVVEHDPVGDPAAVTAPRVGRVELGASSDPIRAANSTHSGSIRDAGSRGTDSPGDHQDFSNPMITCRSVPLPATTRRRLYCRAL